MLNILQYEGAVQLPAVLNFGELVLDEVMVILKALAVDLQNKIHLTRHMVTLLDFLQLLDLFLELFDKSFIVVPYGYLTEGRDL
jgi:hypothetical protein